MIHVVRGGIAAGVLAFAALIIYGWGRPELAYIGVVVFAISSGAIHAAVDWWSPRWVSDIHRRHQVQIDDLKNKLADAHERAESLQRYLDRRDLQCFDLEQLIERGLVAYHKSQEESP